MAKTDIPLEAMRGLLDTQMPGPTIDRDELYRRASAANLGEDTVEAIGELPPGRYTRQRLETELFPAIEERVHSRFAGLGGGPSDPSGHKGARQDKQHGRR